MTSTSTTLRLDVTHVGLGMELTQLAFASDLTLAAMKDKLYPKTGTEPQHMTLHATEHSAGGARLLEGDDVTLEALGLATGDRLTMDDSNEASIANTLHSAPTVDVDATKESARSDSGFRSFRDKAAAASVAKKPAATADTDRAEAQLLAVGARVTTAGGSLATVRFVGVCDVLPVGFWTGVELDDPKGKHDGEVKGVRLFSCPPRHGSVLRPSTLTLLPPTETGHEEAQGHVFEKVADSTPDEM